MSDTTPNVQPAPEAAPPSSTFRITGEAHVVNKPGAVKLCHVKYPLLTYAPLQYGEGIRTEDHGVHIHDICVVVATNPDYAAVAQQLGTTTEHVRQAVDYAHEVGYVECGMDKPDA